tara:strand:- start:14 stop:991 length:978 start_codon:yes stop_codon:yes gene_type:complete
MKKMGPPKKKFSDLTPAYRKNISWHDNYYKINGDKIKQKVKDMRLFVNQNRPPLNLICDYCNKNFSIPGMNKNGFKQRPVKHCSYLCTKREERLKKLWVPKWLYNFYLDKKLYRIVVSFKNSKYSMFSWNRRWRSLGNHNSSFKMFFAGVYDKKFGWFWNPKCFWRKKFKWLDNYKKESSKQNRKQYVLVHSKSEKHKKWVKEWQKRQPKDSNYVITNKLRKSVLHALLRGKNRKNTKTQILLGTNYKTARAHIESLFQPGMTWENHGIGWDKWHIDHIIPCSSFDLKCPVQQLACCHYKNLQPLWQKDNYEKRDKIKNEMEQKV